MAYSPLFGCHGSLREYVQTAKLSTYGLSTEKIADVLEHDARTIRQWQTTLGQKSQEFHLALCCLIGLTFPEGGDWVFRLLAMGLIGSNAYRTPRQEDYWPLPLAALKQ